MINLSHNKQSSSTQEAFAQDVHAGLSQSPKSLPSRYFYDKTGSRLFQEIMNLPEYYLTRAEFEVFDTYKQRIVENFSESSYIHLIDLGAGDALKTRILLAELQKQQASFDYVPIDISEDAMQQLSQKLAAEIPSIKVEAVVGEYFEALQWLQGNKSGRKVVLFLGSNIGNFEPEDAKAFITSICQYLEPGDKFLIGVDLKKDPDVIIPAYNDTAGITAQFNSNLLRRINQELGGNFDESKFKHYPVYEPQGGVMKSYLLSLEEQDVKIVATGKTYHFGAWEAIHTENSYKYTIQQVIALASRCGLELQETYLDKNDYFADVLFVIR